MQKAPACTIQTQAAAVCELFGGKKEDIRVIGIRHGEKMYETLLTNEECTHAIDMGNFIACLVIKRLNYDKYFRQGEKEPLSEFDSNNTKLLNVEEVKEKLLSLQYIRMSWRQGRDEVKILVTGAKGFVGKNLCCALYNLKDGKDRTRQSAYR